MLYLCDVDGAGLEWPGPDHPPGWECLPGGWYIPGSVWWICPGCAALIERLTKGAGKHGEHDGC